MGEQVESARPGRAEAVARVAELLAEGRAPAVYLVAVDRFEDLVASDPDGTTEAMEDIAQRLDRILRSSDMLASDGPGRFVLVGAEVVPEVAGSLMERIEGATALPVDVAGQVLSLRVAVGVGLARPDTAPTEPAAALLERAEMDLARRRG
ncbi:MAG: hypothetical protein ACOYOP_14760 [Microthrixaceae bacterium]